MDVFASLRAAVLAAVETLVADGHLPAGLPTAAITVEPPRDASHGDMATNAALVLAKPAGQSPRAVADQLVALLAAHPDVAAASVAGPGFINLTLDPALWRRQIGVIATAGADYGRGTPAHPERVNVEYVSANPTGPMHVGHCRGAVVGDALANLLSFAGHTVTREYYINDAGGQVDTLARSVHLRYQEAHGRAITIPEGFYPGDYLVPVGEVLKDQFGDRYLDAPEPDWLVLFKQAASAQMMALIQRDLAELGIHHDVFFSERTLHEDGRIAATLADLQARDLVYEGVLDKPKGESADDWEPRPQTLFRATQFGDDSDRALMKSDGSWTYFAADIAYHRDKVLRGFDTLINLWGADHGGYVKRMKAAVQAVSHGKASLDIQIVQMVKLLQNGEPFKMSKRAGTFVTLADVVEQVGKNVVRFMMLTRKADSQLEFDFAKVVEQSKENPVFYVQYAHARICSALRKAQEIIPNVSLTVQSPDPAGLARLTDSGELALLKLVCQWPRMVTTAAAAHEPHRIAYYLYDLASALHAQWNRGNDDPALRFLVAEDSEITAARMALLAAVRQVIRNGLAVMGVDPLDELRAA
jgi:arginyl-tRNA synthetase